MENDGRMGLRCIMPSEQADSVVLKEYATIRLLQVMAERDAAIIERDHALTDKKAAITDRDSAILQRDIAFAERDAAIIERDNVLVALDSARGHRALGWSPFKRQPDVKGRDSATMLQMSPFGGIEEPHAFAPNASMLGFMNNSEKLQPIQLHQLHHQHNQQQQHHHHHQQQQQQYHEHQYHLQQQHHHHQQEQEQEHHHQPQHVPPPLQQQLLLGSAKPGTEDTPKAKRSRKATADDVPLSESKKKRLENGGHMQESIMPLILPVAPFHAQEAEPDMNDEMNSPMEEMQETSYVINTPIPHCSCTGTIEPCYRWGNGGWQSACCTTTLSEHPLPMNPLKKGYRLPGRKMSAGAFQKLVKRLSQEGVDLSQPIDLKDYWSKHGTNRYVTIK